MEYQICKRCIMDTSDPDITFDGNGVCNHCERYEHLVANRTTTNNDEFLEIINRVKNSKKSDRDYDCIVGVSGGVDSSYLLYLAKRNGLNPLAVHVDNGWNSELAVDNIQKLVKSLEVDLVTVILDWQEFKLLQLAFLKASTPDGEIPSDHAIDAVLWREASKRNIKFILSGMNFKSEAMSVPSWAYGHSDYRYINAVFRRFNSGKSLKKFPYYTFPYLAYVNFIKRIKIISLLNYIEYSKSDAIEVLESELGWRKYEGKHYESVYTRFYQGYILPKKFNIDKRRGHLSDLINSGQISRGYALEEISTPPLSEELVRIDSKFVKKKLGISDSEFDHIMQSPIHSFREYPNIYKIVQLARGFVNFLRKIGLYPK